jgi:F0F1-type ATP synthase membrane subunit b/b'
MNRRGAFLFFAAACVVALIFLVAPILAAEGAEQNPAETPIGKVFQWLNFFIVFGGLAYLIAKKAPAFFSARAAVVSAAITEAAAAKAEAERLLGEAEESLARLDLEVAKLRTAAEAEAAGEAERLRRATGEEIERIARAARAEMEAAERAARMELRATGARLAVERAEALLQKQIGADTQAALFRNFVENLPGSAH